MEPERIDLDASGMHFGALAWGDPKAPLAILVHGYPDTAWSWRHLGPHLAERGWRAVAPFTRGYAPTDLAPDDSYLIREMAADVLELHSALGGDERAVLVGHDWGAAVTYAVTAIEPGRFSRYSTLAVPPGPALLERPRSGADLVVGLRQLRLSWYFLYNQLPGAERTLGRLIPRLWRDWSPGYDAGEDVERVLEALSGPGRRRAALRYYRDNLKRGIKDTFGLLPGAPVLYLHGRDDGCLQAELASRSEHLLAPGSRIEIVAGAGHFLQLERPDVVNPLIGGWLGEPGSVQSSVSRIGS